MNLTHNADAYTTTALAERRAFSILATPYLAGEVAGHGPHYAYHLAARIKPLARRAEHFISAGHKR